MVVPTSSVLLPKKKPGQTMRFFLHPPFSARDQVIVTTIALQRLHPEGKDERLPLLVGSAQRKSPEKHGGAEPPWNFSKRVGWRGSQNSPWSNSTSREIGIRSPVDAQLLINSNSLVAVTKRGSYVKWPDAWRAWHAWHAWQLDRSHFFLV